jgi:parallel beta-helix repeat protein
VGVEHVNNKILNNIVLNGIGEFSGTPSTASHTSGIYLDYNSNHVEISGNTAANCGNKGVFMTSTHDISMDNNTFYNNNEQLTFQQFSAEYYSERNTYTNNIYFSKGANQFTYRYYDQVGSGAGDIPTSDYNYYARPIDDDKTFVTFIYGVDVSEQRKTLAEWRTFSGQDAHSHKSPKSITNLNDLLFEYNPTAANKVVALSGSYVDVRNVSYSGSVTLKPFTSIVLIKN